MCQFEEEHSKSIEEKQQLQDEFHDYENMKDNGMLDSCQDINYDADDRNLHSDYQMNKKMTIKDLQNGKTRDNDYSGMGQSSNNSSRLDNQAHSVNMQLLYISSTYDKHQSKSKKHNRSNTSQYSNKPQKGRPKSYDFTSSKGNHYRSTSGTNKKKGPGHLKQSHTICLQPKGSKLSSHQYNTSFANNMSGTFC